MFLVNEVLFDYQKDAARAIAEQRRLLLADQPGLGKTLEVLGGLESASLFAAESGSRILILSPLINAQTTWIDSLVRFVEPRYPINIVNLATGSSTAKEAKMSAQFDSKPLVVVANHNALDYLKAGARVPSLFKGYWDAVIIDESHLVLPITSSKRTNFWRGLMKLQMASSAIRVAISGTPDRGKLENRFGTWCFLHPEIVGFDYWAWLEKNFWIAEQKVAYNRTIKVPVKVKDERTWKLYDQQWMLRRTKAEVLQQLPPKRYVDVTVDLPDPQRASYFGAVLDYRTRLQEKKEEDPASGDAMVFALRSRQLATCQWQLVDGKVVPVVGGHSAKLDWLKEWLAERSFVDHDAMADNKAKVVIVSQFSKVLEWLHLELATMGIASRVLDGSTNNNARIEIQREFQEGDLRVVLLSGGMGVGINLDAADDLIMIDSPYDPDRIEQIEDRVHRASNMHSVTIWNLIANYTIDQAIMETVSNRYKVTRQLMDGSRGIDIERQVVATIRKEKTDGQD